MNEWMNNILFQLRADRVSNLLETPASGISEPRGENNRFPSMWSPSSNKSSFTSAIHQPKEKSFIFITEKLLQLLAALSRSHYGVSQMGSRCGSSPFGLAWAGVRQQNPAHTAGHQQPHQCVRVTTAWDVLMATMWADRPVLLMIFSHYSFWPRWVLRWKVGGSTIFSKLCTA